MICLLCGTAAFSSSRLQDIFRGPGRAWPPGWGFSLARSTQGSRIDTLPFESDGCSLALLPLAAEFGGLVAQASSLWGLVLASTNPRRLEACATTPFERITNAQKVFAANCH